MPLRLSPIAQRMTTRHSTPATNIGAAAAPRRTNMYGGTGPRTAYLDSGCQKIVLRDVVALEDPVTCKKTLKCSQGFYHSDYTDYWALHERLGHPNDEYMKIMLKNKSITGAPSKIIFPPEPISCTTCLKANGIASRVVANDVEHRKTTCAGQSLCFGNMGPISIPDESGEVSQLHYLTSCRTDTQDV